MGDSRRFDRALEAGRAARLAAAAVRGAWFPRRRQRAFEHHLQTFIEAVEAVPQDEAAALSGPDIATLIDIADAVIREAEDFMADGRARDVERDRAVVTRIYRLRQDLESLARHVTADPAYLDLRWQVKTHPTPDA